jgi:UDP-glucuronate 4-epimerase
VVATAADTADLEAATGFRPATPVAEGVNRFVQWYLDYHGRA